MGYTNLLGQVRVGVRGAQVVSQSLLLDGVTGLIGAYSLRKLIGTWTGGAILVRRSLDNTESVIGFDAGGDLDQSALISFVRPTITGYVLDQYSGSSVGLSLRKISGSYSGSAIRVRRSIDNAESNIGFDADGNLDTTGLLSFVNSSDTSTSKLLDQYSGAASAYSLRKLSATYSGSAIRVRRSSDNQEMNIGFDVSGNLNTLSLLSFVGTGNGFVTTWYDQIGVNNFTQVSASNQPQIVSSGFVIMDNNKPTISFGTQNNSWYLNSTSSFLSNTQSPICIFSVWKITDWSNSNGGVFGPSNGNSKGLEITQTSVVSRRSLIRINSTPGQTAVTTDIRNNNSADSYQLWNDNQQSLTSINILSTSLSIFKNGSSVSLSSTGGVSQINNINDTYSIGLYSGSFPAYMNQQEMVFFTTDKTSQRGGIETNINSYYSIYSQSNNGFVKTWYDQSGNGLNATQITPASQPQIVSNGSILLQGGKPSIKYDGVNDYMTISTFTASVKTIFALYQTNVVNNYDGIITARPTGETNLGLPSDERSGFTMFNSQTLTDSFNSTSFYINTFQTNNTQSLTGLNYAQYIKTNSLSGVKNFILGADIGASDRWYDGSINEIIIYPTDLASNRGNFIGNTNTYYNWSIFGNNGYIKTWYDQSGLGRHAQQTTASNQPQIVSNNLVLKKSSRPTISYDGVDDYLVIPTFNNKVQSIFALFNKSTTNFSNYNGVITARESLSTLSSNSNERVGFTGVVGNNNITGFENTTSVWINGRTRNVSNFSNYTIGQTLSYQTDLNLITQLATASQAGTKNIVLGVDIAGLNRYLNGSIPEIFIYSSNESSNRGIIENGINSYYSVYPNIVKTGLVLNLDANDYTSYPQSGTTWTDISDSGNNGTLTNGVGYSSTNGGVMTFDGVNDYVQMSNALTLGTNQFTIEFWINNKYNYTSGNFKNTILSNYLDYNSSWNTYLYIGIYYGTNGGDFGSFNSNGDIYLINSIGNFIMNPSNTGKINITNNQWTHVCFVRNGNDVSTYKNGVKLATINNVSTANNNYSGSRSFRIGGGVSGSQNHFGDLSNNRIYNTALTDAEILQNFNATKSRFGL